ncbi:hypothetical protein O6H91_04G049500 [Diphasiastrum complanatum]|uniref:Uncharacterized protein n=4 Tax=Diphasiastrum complanatum TaxID=34168 RepID=A0ACC2DWG0_DIPCM|nr:hypothetical protein O6H91_04G049500 [Diphasiastrum complanatum]KAJ7558640.1 hypothetical protein O6H91_04G049500 [Diphasiastrum complanatum]KAJ7558642.1 hypothetical protein O6H91_04G049500 [Diphasiastrum complanatum]KAJ7558644.1 hypothetical protein O6H91_04G049500 [Diphasiastrum complanatum]
MSWFSRSVSEFLQGNIEQDEESDEIGAEREEEEGLNEDQVIATSSSGKGVKEDLSELTKSLTKQFWGVASFLAPPPASKSENPTGDDELLSPVHEQRHSSPEPEPVATTEIKPMKTKLEVDSANHPMSDIFFEEGVDSYGHSTVKLDPSNPDGRQSSMSPRFTGIRSDFAELKGGFAKGLSHISSVIRVVAGEDLRVRASARTEAFSDRIETNKDESFPEKTKVSGFNSILRPLLANLHLDKSTGPSEASGTVGEEGKEDFSAAWHSTVPDNLSQSTSGRLKIGFPSNLASHIDGFSKLASSFLPFDLDSDKEDPEESLQAAGVTDEVVTFADSIAMHPETWLDFPFFSEEEDADDFEMSRLQQQHVQAIEYASRRLAALKIELCPHYMHEERFWKIYFVLLHSRLKKENGLLLSTPQELKRRETGVSDDTPVSEEKVNKPETLKNTNIPVRSDLNRDDHKAQSRGGISVKKEDPSQLVTLNKVNEDSVKNDDPSGNAAQVGSSSTLQEQVEISMRKDGLSQVPTFQNSGSTLPGQADVQDEVSEKNEVGLGPKSDLVHESTHLIGKQTSTMKLGSSSVAKFPSLADDDEAEADEWLDDEQSNPDATVGTTHAVGTKEDEDISFSDLEDEDGGTDHIAESSASLVTPCTQHIALGTTEGSEQDPILQKSERAESNDWLTVDEEDVASTGSS